jgi:hypothetical protein
MVCELVPTAQSLCGSRSEKFNSRFLHFASLALRFGRNDKGFAFGSVLPVVGPGLGPISPFCPALRAGLSSVAPFGLFCRILP